MVDVAELRRLEAEATGAEERYRRACIHGSCSLAEYDSAHAAYKAAELELDTAVLAAAPALLDELERLRVETECMRDLLHGFCGALENGEIASDLYDAAKAHADGTWKPPTVVVSEEEEAP